MAQTCQVNRTEHFHIFFKLRNRVSNNLIFTVGKLRCRGGQLLQRQRILSRLWIRPIWAQACLTSEAILCHIHYPCSVPCLWSAPTSTVCPVSNHRIMTLGVKDPGRFPDPLMANKTANGWQVQALPLRASVSSEEMNDLLEGTGTIRRSFFPSAALCYLVMKLTTQ